MIPKHVEEKIEDHTRYWSSKYGERYFREGVEYGYSLAMEQMKPILDAARNVINGAPELTQELDILIHLLKQYDNDSE